MPPKKATTPELVNKPPLSSAVEQVCDDLILGYASYLSDRDDIDYLKDSQDMYGTMRTFADGKVTEPVMIAARLAVLGNRISDDEYKVNIRNALARLAKSMYPESSRPYDNKGWQYTVGVLLDMPKVARAASSDRRSKQHQGKYLEQSPLVQDPAMSNSQRRKMARAENSRAELFNELLHSSSRDSTPVPEELWMVQADLTNPVQFATDLKHINLESFVIKASHALNLIDKHDQYKLTDARLLQKLYDIESFYAPICEIVGFDALGAVLRDKACEIRLKKSGNSNYLELADDYIKPYEDKILMLEMLESTKEKLGTSTKQLHDIVVEEEAEHGVLFATNGGKSGRGDLGIDYRTVARRKTRGSLAMKLFRQDKEGKDISKLPKDIFAETVIVNEMHDAVDIHARLHARLIQDEFAGSVSNVAYQVRGTRRTHQHYKLLMDTIPGLEIDEQDPEQEWIHDNSGMEVSKLTWLQKIEHNGELIDVPIEVQIQTEKNRRESKVGRAAHLLYKQIASNKTKISKPTTDALKSVSDRSKGLMKPSLTDASQKDTNHWVSITKNKTSLQGSVALRQMGR